MKRMDLHKILITILDCPENGKLCRAYFQPGPNVKMQYPSIVYHINRIPISSADNRPYVVNDEYTLTLISKDPEANEVSKLKELPKINFNRYFSMNNLHHWVFTIY